MKKIAVLLIFIILIYACEVLTEPKVSIISKKDGRDQSNKYYWDVELKNEGEKPAYFVILIVKCWQNGKEIDKTEWAYGDLFPSQLSKERIFMNKIGFDNPDSTTFMITYTATDINYQSK